MGLRNVMLPLLIAVAFWAVAGQFHGINPYVAGAAGGLGSLVTGLVSYGGGYRRRW